MVRKTGFRFQDSGFRVRNSSFALALLCSFICSSLVTRHSSLAFAQQPQAQQGQPLSALNAKYVNGVAPGYWPTQGTGLTLNLSAGTSICGNSPVPYAGGTLTMTASATNYVFLDTTNNCTPAFTSGGSGFPVTGVPIAVVATSGSAITAISDVRTWFAARPLPDPLHGVRFSSDYLTGSSTCGVQEAINALPAHVGGTVVVDSPTSCVATVSIQPVSGLILRGLGPGTINYTGASDIWNATTDVLSLAANTYDVTLENLTLISETGGGHVLNLSGYSVGGWIVRNVILWQQNTGKSCIYQSGHDFLENLFQQDQCWYQLGNSVPAVSIAQGGSLNTFESFTTTATGGGSGGTYALQFEDVELERLIKIVCENPQGGCLNFLGVNNSAVEGVDPVDLAASAVNPQIHIAKSSTYNQVSTQDRFSEVVSIVGSATYPDLYIEGDVAGQNQFRIENSILTYVKGGVSAAGAAVLVQDSTINNYANWIQNPPVLVKVVGYSATPNFDVNLGAVQKIALTGSVTSSTLSNCATGETVMFDIVQGSGPYTFVWPTNVLNGGTIGTVNGGHNTQTFYCDGTNARALTPMVTNGN